MTEGSKELQELIDGLMALSCKIAKHLKDGFQWHDIPNLMREFQEDKEFSEIMKKAFSGISMVPVEVKNLGVSDGVALSVSVIPWVQKLIDELK